MTHLINRSLENVKPSIKKGTGKVAKDAARYAGKFREGSKHVRIKANWDGLDAALERYGYGDRIVSCNKIRHSKRTKKQKAKADKK